MPTITLCHWALPHLFSLHLVKKLRQPGLTEPYRCVRLHRWNVQAHNVPSIPWQHGETWPSLNRFCIPICQTRWQSPAMPFGHHRTICQWVWLLGWWMRMWRTSTSICIHPPLECIRWMILMMNHLNLMRFGASVGGCSMLAFGGASQCNGAENLAENAMILWPHCTIMAKSAT